MDLLIYAVAVFIPFNESHLCLVYKLQRMAVYLTNRNGSLTCCLTCHLVHMCPTVLCLWWRATQTSLVYLVQQEHVGASINHKRTNRGFETGQVYINCVCVTVGGGVGMHVDLWPKFMGMLAHVHVLIPFSRPWVLSCKMQEIIY